MYSQLAEGMGTPRVAQELRRKKILLPKAQESEKRRAKLAAKEPGGEYRWDQQVVRTMLKRNYYHTGRMTYDVAENYSDLLSIYREGNINKSNAKLTPEGTVVWNVLDSEGKPVVDKKHGSWHRSRSNVEGNGMVASVEVSPRRFSSVLGSGVNVAETIKPVPII